MRIKVWLSALVLMAAAGCGGGDDGDSGGSGNGNGGDGDSGGSAPVGADAPRDASVEDFCATFEATSGLVAGEKAAEQLAATGTPPDIPEDARRGFELLIDHPEGGPDVITSADVGAYVTWGSTTCAEIINQ